jgi:hypothetical protein
MHSTTTSKNKLASLKILHLFIPALSVKPIQPTPIQSSFFFCHLSTMCPTHHLRSSTFDRLGLYATHYGHWFILRLFLGVKASHFCASVENVNVILSAVSRQCGGAISLRLSARFFFYKGLVGVRS